MVEEVSRRAGYETRDVNVWVVTWFAVGLVGSGVLIFIGTAGLYRLFKHEHPSPEPVSRIVFQPVILAPEPRLQTIPAADLKRFRAEEDARLHSYGWIDRPHGIMHIPIERAMDLIMQRGLPTRGPGTQNSSGKNPEQLQQEKAAATKP
jgi:hypothetical protein